MILMKEIFKVLEELMGSMECYDSQSTNKKDWTKWKYSV